MSGLVCDVNDWGGKKPPLVTPRKRVVGLVNQLFANAPTVVGVIREDGMEFTIRTDV
ncbi:hypothetical protein ACWGIV_25945 [Streptomyces sp. NPDC054844]